MIKDLIEVKQLPIIEQQLRNVSVEIQEKLEEATSLVCTEETVKTIKEVRADLNKDFKEFETQRKAVKEAVLKPYNEFESIYKECITDKFRNADIVLKDRIEIVENELKARKEQEVKEYFEEYKIANNINFIDYKNANINVTKTASMKSLKEQAKSFIDKIADDLKLIDTQEHKAEILVEYKQTLNVSNAITTVMNRFKAVEEEKLKQEEVINQRLKEDQKIIQDNLSQLANANIPTSNANTAQAIQQKVYTIPFKATGTSVQLKMLRDFMEREGIGYESITDSETKI